MTDQPPDSKKDTSSPKESIYSVLRNRILEWHYPPRYHLGERALCEEFAVSRIPIREALRALSVDGLVEKIPNQGCYVRQLDVVEANELFDVRIALELHVVDELVGIQKSPDWLDEEKTRWQQLLDTERELLDAETFVEADRAFHLSLANASGNQSIVRIIDNVTKRLSFIKLAVEANAERQHETAAEHLAILEAIRENDLSRARAAIRKNIEKSSSRVELGFGRALLAAHSKR